MTKRLILLVIAFAPLSAHADTNSFFKKHCVKCHGPDKQKAKLRLDTLAWEPSDADNIDVWQQIIDRIESGEMPPNGEPTPSQESRATLLRVLEKRVTQAASAHEPRQVLLRRLNRDQYRNTIRDLLQIDVTVDDPTEAFPADDKKEGFDNLGEALQMSDFLMRQYLRVARRIVNQATFPEEKPVPVTYRLRQEGKTRAKNFSLQADDKDRDYVVLTRNDERAPSHLKYVQIFQVSIDDFRALAFEALLCGFAGALGENEGPEPIERAIDHTLLLQARVEFRIVRKFELLDEPRSQRARSNYLDLAVDGRGIR